MEKDALLRGFVAAQIGEALANYALADKPLEDREELTRRESSSADQGGPLYNDEEIWHEVFRNHADSTGLRRLPKFFFEAALSEWVPRVPGLYWGQGSEKMRRLSPAQIEEKTSRWITYRPPGKSLQVSGGVGTLKFPASEEGFRLVTLTSTLNASAGVPVLISPEVWDRHDLAEGDIVGGSANWRDMPQKWANQFPVVAGIPRGCLILNDGDSISHVRRGERAPILAHPFSVMEYWDTNAQLHDFVYAEADTSTRDFRPRLSGFFESYRNARGREGHYLMAADISDPMWEATFTDPAEMRERKAVQMRLIESRVLEAASSRDVVEALIRKLSSLTDLGDLKRVSEKADIRWKKWSEGGRLVDEAERLVDAAIQSGKQQALLQAVQLELAS